jgi:hypothetical protein
MFINNFAVHLTAMEGKLMRNADRMSQFNHLIFKKVQAEFRADFEKTQDGWKSPNQKKNEHCLLFHAF